MTFAQVERRAAAPLLVLSWFSTRNIALPMVSQAFTNFAYMGGFFLVPQVLGRPRGFGLSTATVGNLVISRPLAFSLIAPLAALVTIKAGERLAGVVGALGVVTSMLLWANISSADSYLLIIIATGMSGIGLGIASPAMTSLMANAVSESDLGVAGAMQQLMNQLGAVMGSAVLATVSANATTTDRGPFHAAFLVGGGVAVVGAVVAAFVHSTPRS